MPKIRDWTWTYTSTTTTTQLTVPIPKCEAGDLLLAIMSADTGAQTWSSTGWTQLFSRTYSGATNTVNLGVLYKIAGSNETDPTFSYTVAETSNGHIIAIQDVDTSSPIADSGYADINANRGAVPVKSASRDKSLVVYCSAHPGTATAIPSIIEGPVIQQWQADGAAHSYNVAWTFQVKSGNTPNNIYWTTTGTTYSSVLGCIVVNPPSGGAQKVPTYCAGDSSIYVDPIHGTAAFRGNTAFAGTATTYWTSPLANRTLANATVTNRADSGINTFRSAGGMSGPTTANTYQGATLVLADANRVNVTGKNILVHNMPYLPADIQTVYDTGLGKGIEFGIASSANNAIVWHVHGANTAWGVNRVPLIINPSNTSGRIDTRGSIDLTLTKIFGFFTCGYITSSDWMLSMIWISDTTVVAGGTADEPVDLLGTVNAIAIGHERMSAVLQGANQMLLLQPVQFGDGGTNPIVLDLNLTSIELPEIYNLATRQTYYCSIPNYAGITYYAGSNDIIKHRNSTVFSPSPYHWKIHENSSTSAVYDFSGLSLIGAGDIQLKAGITFDGMTFNKCAEVSAGGAVITNCEFTNTTGDGALNVGSSSHMDNISNCLFSNNSTYGIRLTANSADTYDFDNIKFSGNNNDVYIAATSGTVTINVLNGGDVPSYVSEGATVVINNAVTVKVTVKDMVTGNPIENARVLLEAASGGPLEEGTDILLGLTNSQGVISTTYNFTGDQPVTGRVRRASPAYGTMYKPNVISGTITSAGFDVTVLMIED